MYIKQQLEERLIHFSVLTIEIVTRLPDNRVCNHLGGQLLRSGSAPALNYGEALGAESRRDFVHKLGVVLKELRESYNCLRILSRVAGIKNDDPSLIECNELISIFVKSIETARKNLDP